MITINKNIQSEILMTTMKEIVPEDSLFRKIDKYIDFTFIYDKVKDLYCDNNGRPSIDPVVLFKIVFIQALDGLKSMRQTCKNCGYVHKCKYCDIPLTYHKSSNTMRCHYCGYAEAILTICPECHSKNINSYGMGTEKLVEYIETNFPKAKVLRMDNDTTSTKGSHEKMILDFEKQKYNILIGTQMISKGLNFKNVSLVGVISGDSSLNLPDFRSAERTFALINQVAGRAGRFDLKGTVIIQGFNMDHYSIVKAISNDYEGFYLAELKIRKLLKYSPFYNLSLIKIKDKDFDKANNEANKIVTYLQNKKLEDVYILGPAPSVIPKINNVYYMQVIIKYKNTKELIKDFMFIVTDDKKVSYSFSFENKPKGLERVAVGDKIIVKYTGTVSEVDPFKGEILLVERVTK